MRSYSKPFRLSSIVCSIVLIVLGGYMIYVKWPSVTIVSVLALFPIILGILLFLSIYFDYLGSSEK